MAHEYSRVDPAKRVMEMDSINLTFCNFVSMHERMSYRPDPSDPGNKTVMKQETVVTVQGVPLTSYMESIIVGVVSSNSGKGRMAMDWVVDKLGEEKRNFSDSLDKMKVEIAGLKNEVEAKVILKAKRSIEELQRDLKSIQPPKLLAADQKDGREHRL